MHLLCHAIHLLSQCREKGNRNPPTGFPVEKRTLRDSTAKHFLKAQGLGTQLQLICLMRLGRSTLVFHWIGNPQSFFSIQRNALWICAKFYHITFSGKTQRRGGNGETSQNHRVSAFFPELLGMGPPVEQVAFCCPEVFPPLLFNVNQSPLATAKGKVLQAGELEILLLSVHHPMRWQVTPAGSAASST